MPINSLLSATVPPHSPHTDDGMLNPWGVFMRTNISGLPNALLLGYENRKPIWDSAREGHLLTVAPTGAGKGVSCMIPALLTWQGPCIVIDPKGENYAVTAPRRRAMGHHVHVLDPFKITDTRAADSLNPLDLLHANVGDFEDTAAMIASLLTPLGADQAKDPFWNERSAALIIEILKALYHLFPRGEHTLTDVCHVIRSKPLANKKLNETIAYLLHALPNGEFGCNRTRSNIFSSASSHVGFLRSSAMERAMCDSTILLDDITAGAMQTIYIVIPPDKLASHGALLRLWIGTCMAAIAKRKAPPPQPTLFLVDEAAQLGRLNALLTALTFYRSYGCRVWSFWQDISQLKSIYPNEWETVLNNCSTQLYFGAASPQAARALNGYLDDERAKTLTSNEALLIRDNSVNVVQRPSYLTDRAFKALASANPFHKDMHALERA